MRKSWDEYYMSMAESASTLGTCNRLHVGCVIVKDKDKSIISTGFNGSISGHDHCDDVGHLYNVEGRCVRTIHAEQNAILKANRNDLVNATIYTTAEPCENCMKLIAQSGIKRVVYRHPYKNEYNHHFATGLTIEHLPYSKSKPHKLFLITGSSGVGKTSIMRRVMRNEIVSVTNRQMRVGETEGKDYYFIDHSAFNDFEKNNAFAQKSTNYGLLYGILKSELESKLYNDCAFAIVNYEGMLQLREIYPNTTSIFMYANKSDAYRQMVERGDQSESIEKRIREYDNEFANRHDYDYVIRNVHGNIWDTVEMVRSIVKANT